MKSVASLLTVTALALLLALPFVQAQELRAAPPREPDVLRAAPDAGTVAQEQRDIAGRWLGASDAAVQEFAKAGGTLTSVATGKFTGLSTAISVADWASPVGALSAGDIRGAVSGAVAIKTGAAATAGGAALFGEIGAATGGVIGSFLPVIGNIAGTMVGGAIGTAAGGFIAAYGYDKYVKDYVIKRATGLVSVFDTTPLDQAMQARRAFLLQTMSPEQQAQLQTFSPEEAQLIGFAALPYVPVLKQPLPQTPADQQQSALPPGGPSTVTGDIDIVLWNAEYPDYRVPASCRILSGTMHCEGRKTDPHVVINYSFDGTISGSAAVGYLSENMQTLLQGCGQRYAIRFPMRYDFEDGGRMRGTASVGTQQLISNTCPQPEPASRATNAHTVVGTWQVAR
jgi:hypothetical protein